jgi:hypothetical protein
VQELSLHGASHYNHVAFAWGQDDVGGILARGGAVDFAHGGALANNERSTLSEHNDGDHCVVEPSQLSVAVKSLVIVSVSVENGSNATEPVTIGRLEVKFGLSKKRTAIDTETRTQPLLRNVPVVPQYLRLRPWRRRKNFAELRLGVAGETIHNVHPGVLGQLDPTHRREPTDGEAFGVQNRPPFAGRLHRAGTADTLLARHTAL